MFHVKHGGATGAEGRRMELVEIGKLGQDRPVDGKRYLLRFNLVDGVVRYELGVYRGEHWFKSNAYEVRSGKSSTMFDADREDLKVYELPEGWE